MFKAYSSRLVCLSHVITDMIMIGRRSLQCHNNLFGVEKKKNEEISSKSVPSRQFVGVC